MTKISNDNRNFNAKLLKIFRKKIIIISIMFLKKILIIKIILKINNKKFLINSSLNLSIEKINFLIKTKK